MSTVADRTPTATVEEFIRTYNAHDRVGNHRTLSPDFVRLGSVTHWEPMGFDSYKGIFDPFREAFPDFAWVVTNIVAAGEWVAVEVIESATFVRDYHYQPSMTIKATGKSYACHYAVFFKVNAGLIHEYHFYEDPTFATQLGLDISDVEFES